MKQSTIQAQLTGLGVRKSHWCAAEVHELEHLLHNSEEIVGFVRGWYSGGFGILVATPKRLLLVDKKTLFLGVEDIRYDMMSEIDYSWKVIDATIRISTINKEHRFMSLDKTHLKSLTAYIQNRIMEIRHYQNLSPETSPGRSDSAERYTVPRQVLRAVGSVATNPYTKGSLLYMDRRF